MSNYWGNEDLGSITSAAKAGHGEASENASGSAKRHMGRAMATEGLNVGPAGNAQRAGHSSLGAGSQANANNVADVGTKANMGEKLQAQTTDESSSVQKVSASDNDTTHSSLRRSLHS